MADRINRNQLRIILEILKWWGVFESVLELDSLAAAMTYGTAQFQVVGVAACTDNEVAKARLNAARELVQELYNLGLTGAQLHRREGVAL